jgi:hypothetical protein
MKKTESIDHSGSTPSSRWAGPFWNLISSARRKPAHPRQGPRDRTTRLSSMAGVSPPAGPTVTIPNSPPSSPSSVHHRRPPRCSLTCSPAPSHPCLPSPLCTLPTLPPLLPSPVLSLRQARRSVGARWAMAQGPKNLGPPISNLV